MNRDATRFKKTYSLYRQEPRIEGSNCVICNTILNGSGIPASGLGLIDDLYIDIDTMDLYGPKTESGWGDPISLSSSIEVGLPMGSVQYNGGGTLQGSSTFTFAPGRLYMSGSFEQGLDSRSIGLNSHAEGAGTLAYGEVSHAEGNGTIAIGLSSHAEGGGSRAVGMSSHVEGRNSNAVSRNSHAEGYLTSTGIVGFDDVGVSTGGGTPKLTAFGQNLTNLFVTTQGFYLKNKDTGEIKSTPALNPVFENGNTTWDIEDSDWSGWNVVLLFLPPTLDALEIVYNWIDNGATHIIIYDGRGNSVPFGTFPPALESGWECHSEGILTIAIGRGSHVEGFGNVTWADYSHAEGNNTETRGFFSHAEGENTKTFGDYSHSEGSSTESRGRHSHAEGDTTKTFSLGSHAEGKSTLALGKYSHAEGLESLTLGRHSSARGFDVISIGENSHSEGHETITGKEIEISPFAWVNPSGTPPVVATFHLEGDTRGVYLGDWDLHREGQNYGNLSSMGLANSYDYASGLTTYTLNVPWGDEVSSTEGIVLKKKFETRNDVSEFKESIIKGLSDEISIGRSPAVPDWSSIGNNSHAEGYQTWASGQNSHAEGEETVASGTRAHAEGKSTTASGQTSHAEGNTTFSKGISSHSEGTNTVAIGEYSHAEGQETVAGSFFKNAIITGDTVVINNDDLSIYFEAGDNVSFVLINNVILVSQIQTLNFDTGTNSTTITLVSNTGLTDESAKLISDDFIGAYAVGNGSHVEGRATRTYGSNSHAEGSGTKTTGDYSHAEGENTMAMGYSSHAEGQNTFAIGDYSHASGHYTIASGSGQNVVGKYNKHNNTDSLFIVGNGDENDRRSDIFLVNSGSVMIGSASLASDTFFYVGTKGEADKAVFDGVVKSVGGFSGSLTKLMNNQDYLRAGPGISLVTGALGQIEISTTGLAPNNAQYLTLLPDASLTNERKFTPGIGLLGQDAGAGLDYTLRINDSVVATISGSTFSGVVNFSKGLSGSLTKLTNNDDYLLAGAGISLLTGANGSITISSTSVTTPGSPITGIQFNAGGAFGASSNFTFANNTLHLTGSMENGSLSIATGLQSHAEGYLTTASFQYAHSEGLNTLASKEASHSEGKMTEAKGEYSHAEGVLTIAEGVGSHSEGSGSIAIGTGAHSEGHLASALADYSHAEGWATIASGSWSHAEGRATVTSGSWSHAEGVFTIARGEASHAEGSGSLAMGTASHAAGKDTTALGDFSHAGGIATLASGYASTTIGSGSVSAGNFSFAAGEYTVASGSAQSTFGKYNKHDNIDSLFVVGNGSSNESRNDLFIINSGTVLIGSASLAPDTFFYIGTNDDATVSRFDGDVVVSGTLNVKNGNNISALSVVNSKVGIGTSTPSYELEVVGEFAATVKSFVIDHPNKPGWKLRHGTLEGPENGIYVRGRTKHKCIKLPEYWKNLIDESSITVHITPIGMQKVIFVKSVDIDEVHVDCADAQEIEFFYNIQAQRKDYIFDIEYECDN